MATTRTRLFKGLQLGRNAGGGKPLLPQADGLTHDDGLALGSGLGVDDVDFGVGLGGGQAGALVGAGKLLRDSDDNDLIPCIGSFLKQLDKRSRAGLAGAGQLAVLGQAGEELVLGHAAVIHGGGAIGKGDAHGHNGHAGGLRSRAVKSAAESVTIRIIVGFLSHTSLYGKTLFFNAQQIGGGIGV